MSRPKHSPSPWRVEGRYVKSGKQRVVCEVGLHGCWHSKVDEANARVIAVAPDAIDLCRDMLAELDRPHYFTDQFSDAWKAFHRRLRVVADALKSSEAES